MKVYIVVLLMLLVSACSSQTYPYGLSEEEWKSLSIRDQTKLRRDFYFYEKGSTAYVNPHLEIEGKTPVKNNYDI